MSKIGKLPVQFDKSKVTVTVTKGGDYNNVVVSVKGPKGELSQSIRPGIKIEVTEDQVIVTKLNNAKPTRAYHGLYRSIIANLVEGVVNGYEKTLEIHGVGYRGSQKGKGIELSLGHSHKIDYIPVDGVDVKMVKEDTINVSGISKEKVGQVAAEIRALRKPEPYKGKGIRYQGEQIRRKAGKSAAA